MATGILVKCRFQRPLPLHFNPKLYRPLRMRPCHRQSLRPQHFTWNQRLDIRGATLTYLLHSLCLFLSLSLSLTQYFVCISEQTIATFNRNQEIPLNALNGFSMATHQNIGDSAGNCCNSIFRRERRDILLECVHTTTIFIIFNLFLSFNRLSITLKLLFSSLFY